jgi:hypothetical protein
MDYETKSRDARRESRSWEQFGEYRKVIKQEKVAPHSESWGDLCGIVQIASPTHANRVDSSVMLKRESKNL